MHMSRAALGDPSNPLGDQSGTMGGPSLVDSIIGAVGSIQQLMTQSQINKINVQRASQGLQPIDFTNAGIVPTVQTQVAFAPQTQSQLLLFGGLALGGVILFTVLNRKKR